MSTRELAVHSKQMKPQQTEKRKPGSAAHRTEPTQARHRNGYTLPRVVTFYLCVTREASK